MRTGGSAVAVTLGGALTDLARDAPGRTLLVCAGERVTACEADADATSLARALLAGGVRPGDRVAVRLPNGRAWLAALFGIARIGTVVPLNPRSRPAELIHVLARSRARALVTAADDERSRATTGEVARALPDLLVADPLASLGRAAEAVEVPVSPDDVALVQYTSGTTSRPKGVELRHGQVARNAWELGERLDVRPGDRYASGMPMHHVGGSVLSALLAVVRGATLVTAPRFDAAEVLALVARERCTHLFGIETMFVALLERPELDGADLSALRVCFAGGRPGLLADVRARLCPTVVNRYGLTEASGNVTCTSVSDPVEIQLTSAGRPLPGLEVRVMDGEIQVRGWAVMKGYLDDPEATAAAITAGGWLRTGDLGSIDADGRLRFLGRAKDVIRVGGENVASAEIEELLGTHPAVVQAAVVPLEDERLGEVPYAFVEIRDGSRVSGSELIEFCRGRVAGSKVPRHVRTVGAGEWPLTGSGKIARAALRRLAAEHEVRA